MRLRESVQGRASRISAEILGGRYRLDGLLGSGGAADVHRGFDLRLKRPVAVKVFRAGTGFDSEETLHGEAMMLARLDHPGLVTAYDAGQHDGRAFLVMQLVEGTTLRNLIAEGPLSPAATAAVGADLSRALAHAHEVGIVHRDVKPSNILLDGSRRPYLTDFGISRLLDATTRTATGTLVGTAAYLSPEQVLGRPVGRPADVYALGLVLLECLTGRLEYDGGPLEAAIARLHRQPVVPSSVPERLSDLLRDMTALDEQTRPTAHECARTLAAVAGDVRFETAPSESGSPEPVTGLVAPQEPHGPHGPSQTADRTHVKPSVPTDRTAGRTVPARGRTLVVGATAVLAVMATAFAVTDNSPPQGGDRNATRTTGSPSVRTDSADGGGGKEEAAASSTASPADRGASAGTLSGDAGQSVRPGPRSPGPRSVDETSGTAEPAPSDTDALTAATQDGADTLNSQPPGQVKQAEKAAEKAEKAAEKAEKAAEKAERKNSGKTVTED